MRHIPYGLLHTLTNFSKPLTHITDQNHNDRCNSDKNQRQHPIRIKQIRQQPNRSKSLSNY